MMWFMVVARKKKSTAGASEVKRERGQVTDAPSNSKEDEHDERTVEVEYFMVTVCGFGHSPRERKGSLVRKRARSKTTRIDGSII